MMQSKDYELAFVSTKYESATDPVNTQIKKIDKIVKSYDKSGMVIGEAPLMKDLQDVTDVDLVNVNIISIAAIFVIILIIFKSISLPVILVAVIEFAIMINMAIPYYQGVSLPFVASIVIGAIQLGATVDYAILFTDRYLTNRRRMNKKEAVQEVISSCTVSVLTSGSVLTMVGFLMGFVSTHGLLAQLGMLLGQGTLCSVVVVLVVLPGLLVLFDGLIQKTTHGARRAFLNEKEEKIA